MEGKCVMLKAAGLLTVLEKTINKKTSREKKYIQEKKMTRFGIAPRKIVGLYLS